MNSNTKNFLKYTIQLLLFIALWFILILLSTQKNTIEDIINKIEINEQKILDLEMKKETLIKENEELELDLYKRFWLMRKKIEEEKETEINKEWCDNALNTSLKLINDWVSSIEDQRTIMKEEWCDESYKQKMQNNLSEWIPGKLTEDWSHQEMPELTWTTSHERFKELAYAYWLDPSLIWKVEDHYRIKEWVILCITIAETSWWNRWYGKQNIWSVGSNDRWDRPVYALMESWLEAIWKTLNNQYLGWHTTLGCLSNAWSCREQNDNWKRYATSKNSWEANMVACLSDIYEPINPETFNIRR